MFLCRNNLNDDSVWSRVKRIWPEADHDCCWGWKWGTLCPLFIRFPFIKVINISKSVKKKSPQLITPKKLQP